MILALQILIHFLCCIFLAAYVSLMERKLIARIQWRIGPNNCGVAGIFQPIADALKLIFKQSPFEPHSKQAITGVLLLFTISLCQLTLIPLSKDVFNPKNEILLIILCHCLMVFSEILIGTASRSKYGIMEEIEHIYRV